MPTIESKPNGIYLLVLRDLNETDVTAATNIVAGHDLDALKLYALEYECDLERADEEEQVAIEAGWEWTMSDHSDLEFWWTVNQNTRWEIQPVDLLVSS